MRGSTRKRGKTWTAYWDTTDETGKRTQRTKGGFRTRKDAQRHLTEVLPKVVDGTYIEPSATPLARFLVDEWLPGIRSTVRPRTHGNYAQMVRAYIERSSIGAVPLRNLTGAHFNALYADMESRGLSVGTRRFLHAILHRALRDAIRWDKLARNPVKAADPPAEPHSRVKSWSARELRQFLAHVEHDRLFALWRLAATTGMRRGELAGITHQCLDLDAARLLVEQQIVVTKDGLQYGPPKTRRGHRTIALDAETVAVLRSHVDTQRVERELAGDAYEDHDLVFCDELGRPLSPDSIGRRFVAQRKAAGISTGSVHVLRHTAATLALTNGIPLHVVAGRLGDDPRTLLGTYAHLLPHSDEEAANVVAEVLTPVRGVTLDQSAEPIPVDNPLTADALADAGPSD